MTYQRPGVYITERLLPAQIDATGNANAAGAVLGAFAQGPQELTLVNSWYEFVHTFGGYNSSYPATYGVGMFFQNGGSELYVKRVLHTTDSTAGNNAKAAEIAIVGSDEEETVFATVHAKDKGSDGNNLRVQFTPSTTPTVNGVAYFDLVVYREGGPSSTSLNVANDIVLEQFNRVIFSDTTSNDYIVTVLEQSSKYVNITVTDNTITPNNTVYPLAAGANGIAPVVEDYIDPDVIDSFTAASRPLVMFAPEVNAILGEEDAVQVFNALIEWSETHESFVVADTLANKTVVGAVTYAGDLRKSSYGAAYYPNVYISDPNGRSSASLRKVGPAGAIAGLYIQTDKSVGPFKAAAGVQSGIRGAVALERALSSADLDALNSAQAPLNAIRNLPGVGVVSMGARTLLQDGTANKYANMRRSISYLKKNLESIAEFALFENNDERLWTRLRTSLGAFLDGYRNQGGLRGDNAATAFYVKVDAENNPVETIANGEVHIEIGVALQYPAEFIVINLSQKTAV